MPFQEFAPFFSPDELDAMTAAYKEAWPQLIPVAAIFPDRFGDMKAKLAHVILAAACAGKRDKERLEDVALRALAHKQPAYASEDRQAAGQGPRAT
jgi:hypothetical protein